MPDTAASERIADNSRLTIAETGLCLQLANEGLTQTAIAQRLACSQATVSRTLKAFTDTRELAKRRLHGSADRLVRRVIAKADVEESLELLDRIDVAPKRQASAGQGVNIVIGMVGQPIGPAITLSPATFALDAPEQGAGSD